MLHGFTDGHHLNSELSISSDITRISDIVSIISFGVSLISIFGFGRYKQQYRARYSRDVFQAKAIMKQHLEGEDYVHILIDISTLSFIFISNHLSFKRVIDCSLAQELGIGVC